MIVDREKSKPVVPKIKQKYEELYSNIVYVTHYSTYTTSNVTLSLHIVKSLRKNIQSTMLFTHLKFQYNPG